MDENEIIDILTFDELLEDDYYRSEFEKRVQQELDIKNSHSDVKGGETTMDPIQKPEDGEIKANGQQPVIGGAGDTPSTAPKTEPNKADNPDADNADMKKSEEGKVPATSEPAKGMTDEQFELYKETLRQVSKTAKTDLQTRYNAFEDSEVKSAVKAAVLAGEKPDVGNLTAGVVTRLAPKAGVEKDTGRSQDTKSEDGEVAALRAELALVKAGIVPERLEAAKKLFMSEGGSPEKAAEFVAKYPEWSNQSKEGGVTFGKAPPVNGKTAPNNNTPPVMNDFEKKVYAARKARGLPT